MAMDFLSLAANHAPVTVVTIPATGSDNDARVVVYDPEDPRSVASVRSFIAFNETQQCQVFYAANVANGGFPRRDTVVKIRNVALDFDPDKTQSLYDERMRLREKADELIHGPCQPRAIVDTGGGMQVIWQLLEPIDITDANREQVVDDITALMRSLSKTLGADTATCRPEALFRVAGTINWPTPAKARAGRERSVAGLWFSGGPRTAIEDLRALCTATPEDAPAKPPDIDLGDVDEHAMIEVLAEPTKLPVRIVDRLNETPALARALAIEHPPEGLRSSYDHNLACVCLRNRLSFGDTALVLAAYGAKVMQTFEEERLFSYIAHGVAKAWAEVDPGRFHQFDPDQERLAEAQARERGARLRPLSFAEATERLRGAGAASVIKGLMRRREMTVIYGKSGSAKTFVALDMAWRISLGLTWMERAVTKGPVIYVAAESPRSVITRMQALHAHHGASGGFYVVPAVVNMFDPKADLKALVDEIDKVGVQPSAIWFDTLARVMVGGNENQTQDMSQLVSNGDRLRDRFDCNVVWIHHTGKDESLGARGSSALRAATDTEIEISNSTTFRVTKLRDDDPFDHEFKLRQVPVFLPDGEEISTCVVDWYPGFGHGTLATPGMKNREIVIRILRMIGEFATIGTILSRAQEEGLKMLPRTTIKSMLDRSCASDTDRIFKRKDPPEGKKDGYLYGLWEW